MQNKTFIRIAILLLALLLFFSCDDLKEYPYPKEVVSSLQRAGDNKNELIRTLEHYRGLEDSLSYRAACFIISNMKGHFSSLKIETCPNLVSESFTKIDSLTKETFINEVDSSFFRFADHLHNILDTQDFNPEETFVDSLIMRTYPNTVDINSHRQRALKFEHYVNNVGQQLLDNIDTLHQTVGTYPDLENITSDWLIDHIDNAFTSWQESPFARDLVFDEFANTLLTYRSMAEPVDKSSSFINKVFNKIIHSKDSLNIENVIRRLNFYTYCLDVFEDNGRNLGNLGFYDILQFYKFDCDRHAEWTVRVLNACGIPAYLDFTSGYFNRDKQHYGVSVRDTSGVYLHYAPKWQQLGDYRHQNEFSKVFRRMYVMQKCPMTLASINEKVPLIFNNPFMKDVTEEYHKVASLSIPYKMHKDSINRELGYLAIFMPSGWKPVAWGEIDYNEMKINFEKVRVNAMYVAGIYGNKGFVPITSPMYFDSDGEITEVVPGKSTALRITRKFPMKYHLIGFMKEMIGAKIQGANKKDFSDATTLYSIGLPDMSDFSVKSLSILTKRKFRYVRCISDGKPLNIGTFEVFSFAEPNTDIVKGSEPYILSEDDLEKRGGNHYKKISGMPLPSSQDVNKAFDGNPETYVSAFSIGIDFGSPQIISQVRFAPRNANNGIVVGENYELFYYDNGWKSAGSKIANYNFLRFENVPSNTIYWLRNKDYGKEELSFVYKDGKQLFVNNDSLTEFFKDYF